MAFVEFASQVWTPAATGVVITNNTDTSIDGSCKKIVWTELNKAVTISFTAIDLSDWEEISMHILLKDGIGQGNIFKITIAGTDYFFTRDEFRSGKWNHILFDCTSLATISSITITSLVDSLTIMIDYLGYRRVTYDCDVDIIKALKAHINLDYDVATTLARAANGGNTSIKLSNYAYVTDSSLIELDNGVGTKEQVELANAGGELITALVHNFANGAVVRVLCPVRGEDVNSTSPDPVCGIKVFDVSVEKEETVQPTNNGSAIKEYLGSLCILIYIDCRYEKKVLQLAREFNSKYGKEFQFLLDGEQVDIYLESSIFKASVIGENPRMAYFYRLEPQPQLVASYVETVNTITLESVGAEELL